MNRPCNGIVMGALCWVVTYRLQHTSHWTRWLDSICKRIFLDNNLLCLGFRSIHLELHSPSQLVHIICSQLRRSSVERWRWSSSLTTDQRHALFVAEKSTFMHICEWEFLKKTLGDRYILKYLHLLQISVTDVHLFEAFHFSHTGA